MAESEEELKRLLMRVKKESERTGLKLNIEKTKIMASGPIQFSLVQSLSRVRLFKTPWITARQASLSVTNSRSLLKSIESLMPSSHLILCCPLLLLPPVPPSITVFCNESTLCMRWPTYWSFSFSIRPSNEHPGLTFFRMDWLVGSPCSPRDSQESSPTPQFKGINYFMANRRGKGGNSGRFPLLRL